MGGMKPFALTLFWGFSAYVFVVRSAVSKLATGDTGVRGAARDRGTLALLAGVLLVPAWLVIGAAPLVSGRAPWSGGLAVTCVGIALAVSSQRAMGTSWRIGVASSERTALVTGGPFRWVRNPFFTGMVLVAVGTTASSATWLGAVATALLVATIVVQVRRVEEPYLLAAFGDEYVAYASRAARFVPGIGRLRVAIQRPRC
jgi:protein-S-isoprenylcysteine O-methyltransferase Ste14